MVLFAAVKGQEELRAWIHTQCIFLYSHRDAHMINVSSHRNTPRTRTYAVQIIRVHGCRNIPTACRIHGLMAGQLTEYTVVATNSLPAEYTDLWSVHQPYMQWLPHTLCLPNNEHGPVACTYQYPLMMDKPRTPTCCRCNMGANIYM